MRFFRFVIFGSFLLFSGRSLAQTGCYVPATGRLYITQTGTATAGFFPFITTYQIFSPSTSWLVNTNIFTSPSCQVNYWNMNAGFGSCMVNTSNTTVGGTSGYYISSYTVNPCNVPLDDYVPYILFGFGTIGFFTARRKVGQSLSIIKYS